MLLWDKKVEKVFLSVILFLSMYSYVQADITLTTREYEDYRRFILHIPNNDFGQNYLIKPKIKTDQKAGEFEILIQSPGFKSFKGEKLRKSEGEIPVRFTLSSPDSTSLLVTGNTIAYDNLTAFYILEENKYVFDIYKYAMDDNYYSNSVQLLSPKKKKSVTPVEIKDTNETSATKIASKESVKNEALLTKSIKTAGMIVSGLLFLLIATYFIIKIYSGRSLFRDISALSKPKKSKRSNKYKKSSSRPSTIDMTLKDHNKHYENKEPVKQVKRNIINESEINSMLFDKKEKQIRRMMNQKDLNYNEAEMLYNLSHKN